MASIEVMNVKQANPEAPIEIQLSTSNITYRGPKGDQGPAGPAGRDGAVGYDGKSAYELAVDNGFEGTEVEWLASLKGETGATGPAGAQGPAGQNGATPVKGTDYFTQQDIADIVAQVPATDIKFLVSSGSGSSTGTSSTLLSGLSAADKTYLLDAYNDQLKNTRYFVIQDTTGALYYPLTTYSMRLVFLGGISFQNYYYLKFDNVPPSATTIQRWDKEDVVPNWGAIKAGSTAADPFNSSANTSVADAFSYINTNFATKSYVENIVRAAQTGMLKRQVVQALPQSDIDDYTIYMVPKTGSTGDVYNEFLYMDNTWELIGNTQVDLTGYATEAYVNTAVGAISGGTTYTAGTGISIDSNDVISANMNPLIHSMVQMTTAGNDMPGVIRLTNTSTWEEFVDSVKAGKIVYIAASTSYTFNANYKLTPALLGITTLRALNIDAYSLATMSPSVSSYPATGTQIYYQTYYYFDGDFLWSWKKPEDLGNFIKVHYRNSNNTALGYALKQITDSIDGITGLPTPSTTDGTYKLNCAVSSGSPTYSWATDSGGGGSSYTAGSGIKISSNNEISAIPSTPTIPLLLALLGKHTAEAGLSENIAVIGRNATVDEFINGIKAGKIVYIDKVPSGWTGLGTALNDLGFTQLVDIDVSGNITGGALSNADWSPNLRVKAYWGCGNAIITTDGTGNIGQFGKNISNNLFYNNTGSNLSATTIKGAIDQLAGKLPTTPTTDGQYKLTSTITSGASTYSWEADTGSTYTLPAATANTLGGVMVDGTTITVDSNGVVSAVGGSGGSSGGASYTAGAGVEIDSNNVISTTDLGNSSNALGYIMAGMFLGSNNTPNENYFELVDNKDDFLKALKAGLLVKYTGSSSFYVYGPEIVPSPNNTATVGNATCFYTAYVNADGKATSISKHYGSTSGQKIQSGRVYCLIGNCIFYTTTNITWENFTYMSNGIRFSNSGSTLTSNYMNDAIVEVSNRIPAAPTTDGTYTLQCVVSSDTPTYSWVSVS